jgi:hypothetical protein
MKEEDCIMLSKSIEKKTHQQQQIELKLSTIFKQKVIDTPQCFGTFYDAVGGKYCAISALSKYLGYDLAAKAAATTILGNIYNGKNTNPADSIPYAILEKIENFTVYGNHKKGLPKCFCSRPDYYYRYSLISLLLHLNDYHKMTFAQIGNWLESKDM